MSNKERSTVICHRCQWGAAPGHLTQCNSPEIGLTDIPEELRTPDFTPLVKYAVISMAVTSGNCAHFAPVEVEVKGAV